jgi:hypothetical protein
VPVRTDDAVERLYRATTTPRLLVVPALDFLCLDGHGDPNTSEDYARAVQAVFAVSYAVRAAVTRAGGPAFRVSPLECLWWAEDLSTFTTGDRSRWEWTLMVRQPDGVSADLVGRLAEETAATKALPVARELRLVSFEEGQAAQVLHVGPYAAEGPTIARLHAFIHEQGLVFDGHVHKHHEIYLGDPRRAAPERLRTLVRQPCVPR